MTVANIQPVYDQQNGGWSIQGADAALWSTWASGVDTNYAEVPASKGVGVVGFPQNTGAIPAGAVIQSVSLAVRCSLGAGTPVAGQPASLTCAMVSAADPSKYYQKTIYPTNSSASPQTVTVANYRCDPDGNTWDIFGLNNLWLQVFSYNAVADLVRVYEVFYAVYYKTAPSVAVTAPTGQVSTASPTIAWTYTQADADFQQQAEYRIFTAATQAAPSFDPTISAPISDGFVQGSTSSVTIPSSIPSGNFWVYVQVTSNTGAKSAWSGRQFTVYAPSPGIPGVLDPTGVAPSGQGIISLVPDSANGRAIITVQDTSNLLGKHMSDVNIEDSGESWVTTNCQVSESTDVQFPGDQNAYTWKVTATASGDAMVGTTYFPVNASGSQLTSTGQLLAATVSRSVRADLVYYDANYNVVGSLAGTPSADATGGVWNQAIIVDPNIPVNAVRAQAFFTFLSCGAGESHYLTHVGMLYGSQTQWSNGAMASRNLLDAWYSNNSGTAPAGDAWVGTPGTTIGSTGSPSVSGSDGAPVNTMTCATVAGSVALRAVGTIFTATTSGNAYTLHKPTGTAPGDLMVGFVTSTNPLQGTVVPPTGWTLVDVSEATDGSGHTINLAVIMRTAGAAEPSTWAGVLPSNAVRISAVVVGYSGAANSTSQFVAEAQSSSAIAGTVFTTPTITNGDPTSWRISAFAADTSGSAATFTANTQPPVGNPIQFVGAAPYWYVVNSTSTSYTINKPAGVVSGDLMIALLTFDAFAGTITVPAGWTVVHQMNGNQTNSPYGQGAFAVLKRTAGGSEPATWTGSVTSSGGGNLYGKITQCVAYRNCANASSQFLADQVSWTESSPTLWVPDTTNTNASAWQINAFAALSSGNLPTNPLYAQPTGGVPSVTQRSAVNIEYNRQNGVAGLISDSGAAVSPGVHSAKCATSQSCSYAMGWTAFILPAPPGTPPSNETSRVSSSVGSSNPWDNLAVFDSNGVVAANPWSVTGTASAAYKAIAGWVGFITPSSPSVGGMVSATLNNAVSLAAADPAALNAAGNMVTIGSSFIGSSGGTVLISAAFYRANTLISQTTQVGGAFMGTSGPLADCSAQFPVPDGTTAINMTFTCNGLNIGDQVAWNRTFMNLGPNPSYCPGTSAAAHPIWSYPEIQYSENAGDGYGPWATVPGTATNVPAFGSDAYLVFEDHTIVPLRSRKYRVRTVSYGLNGDMFTSAWSPESDPMSFVAQNWWLKDILNPGNNLKMSVKWDDMNITKQTTAVQFQGLGEDFPTTLTEGYKSDVFSVKMIPVNQADRTAFVDMLESNQTLFLQSDIDLAWWVRPLSDITATVLATATRQSAPLREIDVTWIEVAPVD